MARSSQTSVEEATAVAAAPASIDESQVLERESRVLALIPAPEGTDVDVELTFRSTTVADAAEKVRICEFCVTTIDKGIRVTVCTPVPCPRAAPRPGGLSA